MEEQRKLLVERIAASRYLSRSARLRDLLLYLYECSLAGDAAQIHEQEVGHKVFGRPADYDTNSDNIVRVHASMLRKRLEQYFDGDGAGEPLVMEIPKGNYAPIFRERAAGEPGAAAPESSRERAGWRLWLLLAAAILFACSTAFLLLRAPRSGGMPASRGPTVRLFWSQIFRANQATDIVLDDGAIGLYQDLTGRTLALSDYFDRSYLRSLAESAAAARLDDRAAAAMVLRRQSSYASISFLWKLLPAAGPDLGRANLRFARDYNFRALKSDNAVLVGNSRSNPWAEPFESKMGLHWAYDKTGNVYDPVDRTGKSLRAADGTDPREGYAILALAPNLGGNGTILLVSATGGSAMNATADFLGDEPALAELRRALPAGNVFPWFEALLRLKGRSTRPRDAGIVVCRRLSQ